MLFPTRINATSAALHHDGFNVGGGVSVQSSSLQLAAMTIAGGSLLQLNSTTELTGDVSLQTTSSNGLIQVLGKVNGQQTLTLASDQISIQSEVGSIMPLTSVAIDRGNLSIHLLRHCRPCAGNLDQGRTAFRCLVIVRALCP